MSNESYINAAVVAMSSKADKALVDALARAEESAAAANRELEALTYAVSHDLRAPLRSIDGFSQALLEDYTEMLDAVGKKYLSCIRESAQRLAQMLDALLSLSRIASADLRRERVDISALARDTIGALAKVCPDRNIDVVIPDELFVVADKRLLGAAVDHLLGNAWKFTRERDVARIELGLTVRDGRHLYFVRDNGVGFDMAFAGKLFGVFQRLHAIAEFEGVGVGLATTQRIIGRHHGAIWGEAKVGEGATFFFTLDDW